MDTIKDNMNSFLGVLVLFAGLIFIPEIRKKKRYWIPLIIISCMMFLLGIDKFSRDKKKDSIEIKKDSAYKLSLDSMNKKIETLNTSVSVTNTYLHRLDSIGIKRDSITNMPKITKNFTNYIKEVGTLNQY